MTLCACSAPAGTASVPAAESPSPAAAVKTASTPAGLSMGDFSAQDFDGQEVTQAVFADASLSLVNVWATWCGPCLSELPGLEAVSRDNADAGLQVIGIVHDLYDPATGGVDQEAFEMAEYIKGELSLTFMNLIPDESLYEGILSTLHAFPTTFFVDAGGNIVGDPIVGSQSEEDWQALVSAKLSEVKQSA